MKSIILNNHYIQMYFSAVLAIFTVLWSLIIHNNLINKITEVWIIYGLSVFFIVSILLGLIAILSYYVFFNLIFKIRLKNTIMYFLILFLSSLMLLSSLIPWLKSYGINEDISMLMFLISMPLWFLTYWLCIKLFQKK